MPFLRQLATISSAPTTLIVTLIVNTAVVLVMTAIVVTGRIKTKLTKLRAVCSLWRLGHRRVAAQPAGCSARHRRPICEAAERAIADILQHHPFRGLWRDTVQWLTTPDAKFPDD